MDSKGDGDERSDFALGLGCSIEKFTDLDPLMKYIRDSQMSDVDYEGIEEGFSKIVNYYCEQPHLLDPHLEFPLISTFIDLIKKEGLRNDLNKVDKATKLFVHLIKCRGPKFITKYFPHSVNDLPFIIKLINQQKVIPQFCRTTR